MGNESSKSKNLAVAGYRREPSFSIDSRKFSNATNASRLTQARGSVVDAQIKSNYLLEKTIACFAPDHGSLNAAALCAVLGPQITKKIWQKCDGDIPLANPYAADSTDATKVPDSRDRSEQFSSKMAVNHEKFVQLVRKLFENHDRDFVALFAGPLGSMTCDDVIALLQSCAAAHEVTIDDKFMRTLTGSIFGQSTTLDTSDVILWIGANCYRLLAGLKAMILGGLRDNQKTTTKFEHPQGFLTTAELWLLSSALPSTYLNDQGTGLAWNCLYNSVQDGLSTSNFSAKVSGYKGPSVLVLELDHGAIYVAGIDGRFDESSRFFGGEKSCVVQLQPQVAVCDVGGELFYFQLRNRTLPRGLKLGRTGDTPICAVESDFGNVHTMEMWACGTAASIAQLTDQKKWEKRQVERNKHVPLPGKWEENPDRLLLEMAGIQTDHPKDRLLN